MTSPRNLLVSAAALLTLVAPTAGAAAATSPAPATATSSAPAAANAVSTQRRACSVDPAAPKRQLRSEWIASVVNIDWPSKPGLSADEQKAELVSWLDEAVARGLNSVVLQVRPTADAFWPSPYEPWSKYLTGTQGQDPGYDPLAFAVREAHARNLELHAWFNPYRVSMDTNRDALVPSHPARQHPDWVVAYGGKLYYDPGIPEVRRFVEKAIMDAVRNYDIDAVHFDDYFYPYPTTKDFPDADTFATYGGGFTDKADWRRHNINLLVRELNHRIHRLKPWVKFGVSPFAVWRNQATDPRGSATTAGAETYDDLYADTRRWVRQEWVDYIAPQVYWNIGFAPADYGVLVPWWARQTRGTNVQLYIGHANYKVGTSTQDPAWSEPREMTRQLYFNRDYPRVKGDIYFSAKDVRANRLNHMGIVQADHYQHPALIPVTRGVPGHAPRPPRLVHARRAASGDVTVSWRGPGRSFAVYRFAGRKPGLGRCAFADADHLVATVRRSGAARQRWVDTTVADTGRFTYYVTGLDRAYRESAHSRPAFVR